MSTKLSALATAAPLELLMGDLNILAGTLARAQRELEAATGGRHSWLDAPIAIAKDRASNPIPAAVVELPHVVLCMEGGDHHQHAGGNSDYGHGHRLRHRGLCRSR